MCEFVCMYEVLWSLQIDLRHFILSPLLSSMNEYEQIKMK